MMGHLKSIRNQFCDFFTWIFAQKQYKLFYLRVWPYFGIEYFHINKANIYLITVSVLNINKVKIFNSYFLRVSIFSEFLKFFFLYFGDIFISDCKNEQLNFSRKTSKGQSFLVANKLNYFQLWLLSRSLSKI